MFTIFSSVSLSSPTTFFRANNNNHMMDFDVLRSARMVVRFIRFNSHCTRQFVVVVVVVDVLGYPIRVPMRYLMHKRKRQ